MRPLPMSLPAAYTRSQFTLRRPASKPDRTGFSIADDNIAPAIIRSLLQRLGNTFAFERRDPQCGDAVAALAQYVETITVKREILSGFGNRPSLVNHEPGNGGGIGIRQMPIHGPIEVANRHCAIDIHRTIGLWAHP